LASETELQKSEKTGGTQTFMMEDGIKHFTRWDGISAQYGTFHFQNIEERILLCFQKNLSRIASWQAPNRMMLCWTHLRVAGQLAWLLQN